jgi:hypothetical protein
MSFKDWSATKTAPVKHEPDDHSKDAPVVDHPPAPPEKTPAETASVSKL